jgi:hypothetical protein
MRILRRVIGLLIVCTLMAPASGFAQTVNDADTWRSFVENVPVGSELDVRLRSGQRFRATIVRTTPDTVMVLPKTRVPVPVQPIAYDEIASLERHEERGMSGGKAAAIGVASGVGGFFGAMLIVLALVGD